MKIFVLLVLSLLSYQTLAFAKINVTMINPAVPGTPFWDRVTAAAQGAANSLNINLTVIYGNNNRVYYYNVIAELLKKSQKPDYIILSPYSGSATGTFTLLNDAKVPFVTLERTLHPQEQNSIGLPQQNYPFWLGEIFHDNTLAGKLLGQELIKKAQRKLGTQLADKPFQAVGISGSFSGESDDRVKGFIKAVREHGNTNVQQIVSAGWSRETSRTITHQLSKRYQEIDIIWTAADELSLGVVDVINTGSSSLEQSTVVIGGIDWTPEAISKVKTKEIDVTVGGHFMQSAWALVKIFDHHQGINVFDDSSKNKVYKLEAITDNNINRFLPLSKKINWDQVDFKRFSLFYNKDKKDYDFGFKHIINQL
jgi:ABC-type sugar transport system substrate-binding protein